jgi:hypothetical protein
MSWRRYVASTSLEVLAKTVRVEECQLDLILTPNRARVFFALLEPNELRRKCPADHKQLQHYPEVKTPRVLGMHC